MSPSSSRSGVPKGAQPVIGQFEQAESPYDRANCFSRYFLYFALPTLKRGYRQQLRLTDVIRVPEADRSRRLGTRLKRRYDEQAMKTGQPSFLKTLFRTYGGQLLYVILLEFMAEIVGPVMQTVALGWIVRDSGLYYRLRASISDSDLQDDEDSLEALNGAYMRVIYDSLVLVAAVVIGTGFNCPGDLRSNKIGLQIRAAAGRMIYKKSLRLNQAALQMTTVGQTVNLLSNDINRFDDIGKYLALLVLGPLQSIIILILLATFYIGPLPTLAVFLVLLSYLSLQSYMSYSFGRSRSQTARITDERVKLVNEMLKSIQIIKMYAWEEPFKRMIEEIRKREMAAIRRTRTLRTLNIAVSTISWMLILFAALETYILVGNQLSSAIVLLTLSFAQTIGLLLSQSLSMAVAYTAEAYISCQRIDEFLQLPEQDNKQLPNYKRLGDGSGITFTEVTCSWPQKEESAMLVEEEEEEEPIIRSLSFKIRARDLVLIVGRVGSGKSSILMAILGELPVASGLLEVAGRISYASQEPWIYSGSVRENILFGQEYEPQRYQEVLRVCSLERDLEILVEGDSTIVGERGVSLSGGQKARVNLARALYTEADIYLLDDPLAAVDAPVARHIFNECLRTFLKKKTVVLATHQLQFLKYATKVLVVDREHPAAFGSLEEVTDSKAFEVIGYSKEIFEEAEKAAETDGSSSETTATSSTGSLARSKKISPLEVQWEAPPRSQGETSKQRNQSGEKLQAVSVNWSTYAFFVTSAFSTIGLIWFILTAIGSSLMRDVNNFFVTFWADSIEQVGYGNRSVRDFLSRLTFGQISSIYAGLLLVSFIISFLKTSSLYWACLRASKRIHGQLVKSVLHAPMKFFNFTPAGVLLNRFSRDLGFLDDRLPPISQELTTLSLRVLQTIIITSILNPLSTIGFLVLVPFTYALRRFCSATTKRLKQIESVQRSPIYSLLSTTASGLATVRAFQAQDNLVKTFDERQDTHSSAWFSYICASRWFLLHMDLLKMLYILLLVAIIIFSLDQLSPTIIGLLLTLMTSLPRPLLALMTKAIDLEGQMASVERLREFSALEPEEKEEAGDYIKGYQSGRVTLTETPLVAQAGEIKFTDVRLSYFPDEPPVLKGISFTIEAGEKVGVVGRTGAGKSSIVSVLFRLYDFEGLVEIDGLDIKQAPLAELRRALSIIPQDPVLFSGTIRKNLDPFDEYQDDELWAALEAVQLKPLITQHSQQLEFMISEGGANFSVGQRQLICLARAILRRNKVLVLDEATANVDPETDGFIQETIARQFAHCTVVTIAHRLITIANADRVLVLEQGEVKEFAKPLELIEDSSSLFSKMVASLSDQQAAELRNRIKPQSDDSTSSSSSD